MFDHCLYFNVTTLNRKITKIWELEFGKLNLSPSHGYLLDAIAKNPEISHKALSDLMELDPSTITRFLDKLDNKGLIAKSGKWKGATFHLTAEGAALQRSINKLMKRLFKKMQNHFGKEDFSVMVQLLHRSRRALG
jgi:DNA-binding MarR family transcriptional regulator